MPGSKIADGVWLFDLPLPVKELTERGDADELLALLEKSDGWVAYKAGECLAGVLGDPRAVELLLRHLRAFDLSSPTEDEVEDWKTVAFALMCLEPPGSPASDELLKTLEERDFEDVEYAGKLLAAIGDQRAIEPLVKRLRSDPTGEGSYWVVSALGDLRTVEAVDALIAALPLSDNLGQENIAMALERIGDPRSIPALIVALESHHGKDWAWNPASNAILNALEHFGTPEAKQAMRAYEEDVKHRMASVSLLLQNLEAERAYCLDHPDATDDLRAVTEWTCERLKTIGTPEAKKAIKTIRKRVEPDWPNRSPYE